MPLNIHQGCKDKIKAKLIELLPTIIVNNKRFVSRDTALNLLDTNDALPEHGSLVEKLHSIIGEWPIYDFVYSTLSKELQDNQTYDSSTPELNLNELDEYTDIEAISNRLVEEFDSLPWNYRFTIDLKSTLAPLFSNDTTSFEITDSIRLLKPDEDFISNHPLTAPGEENNRNAFGLGLLGITTPSDWNNESVYLQIDAEGYLGKYVTTQTTENVATTVKAFVGLSIALRILKVEHKYHPATPKLNYIIHKSTSGAWCIEESDEINDDISRALSDLILHELDGSLDTETKQRTWINTRLEDLQVVFNNTDKSERILLAGQWFFDSYSGRNELLSFVQTMVSLEILLGDKASSDMIGLGELLRNRCAYLIGKTHDQRNDILSDFKEIYDIRSKIVHRGKSKLTVKERGLFWKLQWYCRRVINEEIVLLKKNA